MLLSGLRQEDYKFKASLGYRVSFKTSLSLQFFKIKSKIRGIEM